MSTATRIAHNSLYQLFGKLIVLAISLITVSLLAHRLGVSAYGTYTIAMTYSQLYAILGDLGIGVYVLKRLSAAHGSADEEGRLLGSATETRVITAMLGSLLALGITYFLPYSSPQRQAIAIAIVAVVLQMMNSLFITVLQARLEMRYAAAGDILGRLATFLIVIVALYMRQGVAAVIAAQILGNLANLAVSYFFAVRFIRPSYSFDANQWSAIVKSSLLIGISSILSYVYFKTDTFLLSILHIPGRSNAIEVGLYGAAYKFVDVLLIVPGVFLGSVFPLFTRAIAKGDRANAVLLTDRSFQTMLGAGLVACAGLSIFAGFLIRFVAGSSFIAAAMPLRILAFAIPINFIGNVFTYTLLALERQRSLTWLYGCAAIFNIVANLLTIPHYSYVAAATTTVLTEVLVTFGGCLLLGKYYPISFNVRESVTLVIPILTIGVLTWLIPGQLLYVRLAFFLASLCLLALVFYRRLLAPYESASAGAAE